MTTRMRWGNRVGTALLLTATLAGAASAQDATGTDVAALTLGSETVLRLHGTVGKMTGQQRVDDVIQRVSALLGTPNILPSDVVVYAPPGKSPSIYALGRRLLTVDPALAASAGGDKPIVLATRWAKRFQQILPRINYRPSNAPETKVPANPPLTVTQDFLQVGGGIGQVRLHDRLVFRLIGPQNDGMTAAEKADALTARLDRLAERVSSPTAPDAVQVVPQAKSALIQVAGTPVLTITPLLVKAEGDSSPTHLATVWAKNIRLVLAAPIAKAPPLGQLPAAPSAEAPAPTPAPAPPAAADPAK